MHLLATAALAFLPPFPSAAFGASAGFIETLTPHFQILHQSPFTAPGLAMDLERIHNRLRLDLSMFAPWMAKERVKVFLYRTQRAYLAGTFRPPSWSNGIAFYDRKTVASFEQGRRLSRVLGHELTHLFIESWWQESRKAPPPWINEGLAMLEETDAADSAGSDWYQAMPLLEGGEAMPLDRFLRTSPARDLKNQRAVALWYVQAYSLVRFLYRGHSRLQFFNFCSRLREGRPLGASLWTVYRYPSLERLEAAWRAWLSSSETRRRYRPWNPPADDGSSKPGDRARLKPMEFKGLGFKSLIPD
jgi:hypothetical protein